RKFSPAEALGYAYLRLRPQVGEDQRAPLEWQGQKNIAGRPRRQVVQQRSAVGRMRSGRVGRDGPGIVEIDVRYVLRHGPVSLSMLAHRYSRPRPSGQGR